MRKISTILFLTFLLTSCDKNDDGPPPAISVANQTELEQTVYADHTTGKSGVTFTTAGAWTSSIHETPSARSGKASAPEWISIDPASGDKAGSYTINISLEKNLSGAKRSATITISCGQEQITISIMQEATTEDGKDPNPEPEPEPELPTGNVQKINGQEIKYLTDNIAFEQIGSQRYLNKHYSQTEWAYLSNIKADDSSNWICYFNYNSNSKVEKTEFYYGSITTPYTTTYKWDNDKLTTVFDAYYDEKSGNGMRLDIEYGDTEYTKGNIDINWLVTTGIDGNNSFKTPQESAIGIRSIAYGKLISRIILTDLNHDKYSSTYTYRYESNTEGYITAIYRTAAWKLEESEREEELIFKLEY